MDDGNIQIQHLLFYNNPSKGIKKKLLRDLYYLGGNKYLLKILDATYDHWGKFENSLFNIPNPKTDQTRQDQTRQDQVLLYFLQFLSNGLSSTENFNNEQLAYTYLIKFFTKDPKLPERLKQYHSYQTGLVINKEKREITFKEQ